MEVPPAALGRGLSPGCAELSRAEAAPAAPRGCREPLGTCKLGFSPRGPAAGWMPCAPRVRLCLPGKGVAGLVPFTALLKTSKQSKSGAFLSYIYGNICIFSAFDRYSERVGRTGSRGSTRRCSVVQRAMKEKGFCGWVGVRSSEHGNCTTGQPQPRGFAFPLCRTPMSFGGVAPRAG